MNLQTQEAVTTSIPVIRPFEEAFASEWDQFVLEHADGTLFHTIAWKRTIERAFGFSSRYLVALRGNTVCGILPLFLVSNWVLGSTLISTPFAVYGGLVANDDSARQALCDAARQMAVDESVEYLEMRELRGSLGGDFQTKQLYVTFEGELPRDPLRLLQQLPKDTRYMVRKGQKNGLRAVRDNGQLDAFYHVYGHSVRHLGTPVFAKRFFEILLEEFKEAVEITMIWHGRTAVAGVFSFRFRDRLLPYYGGSLHEARHLATNTLMYWEVIRDACERSIRVFDFGRSKLGTGSYFFKTQWNMQEQPLPYQYFLVARKTLPNFSPLNPRFKLAIALWKHVPLPVTKVLGPALVKLFP